MKKKKNKWAVELANLRARKLSSARRQEIARMGGLAKAANAAKKNLPCP
jgi:hypothetical protein